MVPGEVVATQHRVEFRGMVPGEVVATQHRVGYCRGTALCSPWRGREHGNFKYKYKFKGPLIKDVRTISDCEEKAMRLRYNLFPAITGLRSVSDLERTLFVLPCPDPGNNSYFKFWAALLT